MSERPEPAQRRHIASVTLPRTFRSFRNHNFRLLWFGQLISLTGTWMQSIAQAWLVLEITASPLALGTVIALQFLPVLLFSLFAGVLVDRVPKRRLLIVTQSVALVQAAILAVLVSTGQVQLWHVYALAALLGLVNSFDNPARQAFIYEMVGRENLVNAVALNSTLFNSARVFGPALGGLMITQVGLAACFYLNALSFVAVLIGLLLIREDLLLPRPRRPAGRVLSQLIEGLSFAVRSPSVLPIVILIGFIGMFGYNFTVSLPLLARNALNVGATGFGALSSALGLGSLGAALALASMQNPSRRLLYLGSIGFALILAAVAFSRWYVLSLGLMILLGVAGITVTTTANSLLQLTAPDTLRGRMMGLYTLLFIGSTPIGGFITGALADRWGIRLALSLQAMVVAFGVAIAIAFQLANRRVAAADTIPNRER